MATKLSPSNLIAKKTGGAGIGGNSGGGGSLMDALRNNLNSVTNNRFTNKTNSKSIAQTILARQQEQRAAAAQAAAAQRAQIGTMPIGNQQAYNTDRQRQQGQEVLKGLLRTYGFTGDQISSLSSDMNKWLAEGYDPSVIMDAFLPQSSVYQNRFKANQVRVSQGKAPLSEREYFGLENAYRGALSRFGLPASFFDSQDDFASWIAGDVSPDEIASRAKMYSQFASSGNEQINTLKNYYGVSSGDLAAFMMNRSRGEAELEKIYNATAIGAEATRAGLGWGRTSAEELVERGISSGQAREAFVSAAENKDLYSKLSTISKQDVTTKDLVNANLNLDAESNKRVGRLASQERARFGGTGAGNRSLGGNNAGRI